MNRVAPRFVGPGRGRDLFRDSVLVITASVIVRVFFVWFKGTAAYSSDLKTWSQAAEMLADGRNRYDLIPIFPWPPVWIQILYLLRRIGGVLGVSVAEIVPIFLVLTEQVLIVVLLRTARDLGIRSRRALALWGIALNPVCVILVCQHGNFDVLVGLLVLCFAGCVLRFQVSRSSDDWLCAAFWLGVAIALKSVPVLLLPLLLAGERSLSVRARLLGAVLALGPTLYGLSILHVFRLANIRTQILGYRSAPGWFGASGWFRYLGKENWLPGYSKAFTVVLFLGLGAVALAAYRERIATPRRLVGVAALLLALVPALGPGYGPQYFYWFWPLLLVAFGLGSRGLRLSVGAFGVVAAVTYSIEYAFSHTLGAFLAMRLPATEGLIFGEFPRAFGVFTLLRTPLWLAYLVLLVGLAREIARRDPDAASRAADPPPLASALTGVVS